jgi:hypothetical protein
LQKIVACQDLHTLQFLSKSHYPFWSYFPFFIKYFKRNNSSHSCRTLSTVGHFFVDLDMLNMFAVSTYHLSQFWESLTYMFFTAILITYIKGGTPAQFYLEKGSAMMRATFVFFFHRSYQVLLTTSHCVIELLPFDYLSNQKQWVDKKMHFKRNNSSHSCRIFFPSWSSCPFFIKFKKNKNTFRLIFQKL